MMKLLRETDNRDDHTLDATASFDRASLFTLAGGHRRTAIGPWVSYVDLVCRADGNNLAAV